MRLNSKYYRLGALELAPLLLGKYLVRKLNDGSFLKAKITEVEAYCGEEDLACHASKGRTKRTEIMYHAGGKVYVYFIYGMYWMLNVVCGNKNEPQAILIRGIEGISGPGRVGKALQLNRSFYGEDLTISDKLWIEDEQTECSHYKVSKRIGIDYSGEIWSNKLWRFNI